MLHTKVYKDIDCSFRQLLYTKGLYNRPI
ncbi:hypothetical protein OOU_Y34scaffold00073g11 [Pyricularia oryzae Y34]|uniref:Uncharacterized protein n=1 Tax=Pyricularia oryzae (strain Y34) TaxID=1143189 RepID=A0AA97P9W5_PYRO3|nr:hypothetical protein OOU_Y34scaffold00073g11 [Pyricularia oryzae Y34]